MWLFVFMKLFTLLSHGCHKNFKLRVYVISREGNCTQGSSFRSIFLLLPIKVAGAHPHIVAGENPWQTALSDNPAVSHVIGLFTSPPETGE